MPVSLFVRGASLLNADESILKHQHQHTSCPGRGRTEAALCRLASGKQLDGSEEYFLLIYLSVGPALSLALHLSVSVVSSSRHG